MKAFYVITADEPSVSWGAETDASETFSSLADAERRAIELAGQSPGETFHVVVTVSVVVAPIEEPKVHRLATLSEA